jgi:16S rRNA A1518/A1519 N6-dimethyltransferase RsmA/KsgA/DIM1 with predicted DNA glycosylase/AP lyase activity
MSGLEGLPPLARVIAAHGLSARKSLGQNFLLDLNLTGKIARQAGDLSGCDVLEIGPGPGGLTRGLLTEGARRVLAIEKDTRCLPALEDIAAVSDGRLEVINGDALEIDPLAHLTALPEPRYPADPKILEQVVARAFNQRRKMLRAALKGAAPDIEDRLLAAGIEPTDRAETVDLERFCALARRMPGGAEA